jgi:dynein heavy chain
MKLKRKNFSTPKNYLDFLSNYKKLLVEKRSMYVSMVERYSGGLEKLAKASVEVSIM